MPKSDARPPQLLTFYGWIPILSSCLLSDCLSDELVNIFPKYNSDTDDEQFINGELSFDDEENGYLNNITLLIPEKDSVSVDIKIFPTGLLRFKFKEITFGKDETHNDLINKKFLPIIVYDIIKDIYHDHIHHEKDADCKLKPIEAETENEAVNKILEQYNKKIFFYHKDVKVAKNICKIPGTRYFKMLNRLKLMNTALGEFIYAQSFIDLNKDKICDDNTEISRIKESFKNGYNSVKILYDKSCWEIGFVLSVTVMIFTVWTIVSPLFIPLFIPSNSNPATVNNSLVHQSKTSNP